MQESRSCRRRMPVLVVMLLGAALVSCASNPAPNAPARGGGGEPESSTPEVYTGRVTVIVTDQNGDYVDRATVEMRSTGKEYWHRDGLTDPDGRVTFNGVPPLVQLGVVSRYGSYSEERVVPQAGVVEARIIIQTFGADEPQVDQSQPNGRL
jgi:hypothetical protein